MPRISEAISGGEGKDLLVEPQELPCFFSFYRKTMAKPWENSGVLRFFQLFIYINIIYIYND
jgi:hypothetical protein